MRLIEASRSRLRLLVFSAVLLTALTGWAFHHVLVAIQFSEVRPGHFATAYAAAFLMLAWQVVLYTVDRPKRTTPRQQVQLDKLRVAVPIPAYNEDPELLRQCLASLLRQTRRPQIVYVVDDGSSVDYSDVEEWFFLAASHAGVEARWERQENAGKRHAQGRVFERLRGSVDLFLTTDSDAIFAPDAIEELLKPLADPKVQSVAGIVVAENAQKNLLTRFTDLLYVTAQLVDRASMSVMGSVLVNSGPIAVYRAELIWDNLNAYLNETFMGRAVVFSDDSMLTLYARMRGKTVQQSSAYVFSAMPENVSHHMRQYLRWMRGSTIRSVWRFRYLPLDSYAYWMHFFRWFQVVLTTVVFTAVFVVVPTVTGEFSWWLLAVPVLVGYAQSLRYLTFMRSDETLASQLWTYALAPVAMVWSLVVLRVVRWYAMATCWSALDKPNSWGTRQNGVEVSLEPQDKVPA
jgi:hyaluronan synthase